MKVKCRAELCFYRSHLDECKLELIELDDEGYCNSFECFMPLYAKEEAKERGLRVK